MFQLNEVRYKQFLYVKELTIPEGQVGCICGRSGAGKTTILRLLNHMITADTGTILYRGKDVRQWNPVALRRQVVMLAQVPLVFSGTLRDNLLMGLAFASKPTASDAELVQALDWVHLDKSLDADAATFSGGEQQRMALARVMLMKPDVLLLDEPSASLDKNTEELVLTRVVELVRRRQKSAIMVTHSHQSVQLSDYGIYFDDQVWKMKEGNPLCPMET